MTHTEPRPGEAFRAWAEPHEDSVVVHAVGELDLASSKAFEDELRGALGTEASAVVVDLSKVTFMDSTGLRALLTVTELSSANGGRLGIRRELTGAVQRTLEVTGTAEKLPFVD
ncbi:MAG TPA: STAS domain-containing protein [Solirubrobacterales bacterium]